MPDMTDYHIYQWSTTHHLSPLLRYTFKRLPIIAVTITILSILSQKADQAQNQFVHGEIFALLAFGSVVFTFTLNTIIYYIRRALGPKIKTYSISNQGITINSRTTQLDQINQSHLKNQIKKLSDPDFKPLRTKDRTHIVFRIKTNSNKRLTLQFERLSSLQSAIKALDYYLSKSSS